MLSSDNVETNSSYRTFPSSAAQLTEVQETLNLLGSGEAKLFIGDRRDVVLVLGLAGSGKTTLTQFLAGDNNALIATEEEGVFVIGDGNNRIGNSTTTSKTIFPELVVDPKTDTAFYDCPGFSDTRTPSYDIATSYFMQQVFNHVRGVKMLFTVGFSSVEVGNDREGFVKLLSHVCNLVENVDKFENSILIVVTKVRNAYDEVEGVQKIIADNVVIDNIAGFMLDVREALMKRNGSKNIDDETSAFYSCAIKLIDIFSIKVSDTYTRIGIFRRPIEAGNLSKSELLVRGKQNIETILSEHVTYTARNKDDFNVTISESSKNYITNNLTRKLNVDIMASLKRLSNNLETKLVDDCIRSIYIFKSQLRLDNVPNGLKNENTFTNPKECIEQFERSMETITINGKDILTNVTLQIKFLEVFQSVSKSNGKCVSTVEGSQTCLQAREFVRNLNSRYVLILDMYKKHSNYQRKHHVPSYKESDLIDWGKDGQLFNLSPKDVHTFLANYSAHNMFNMVDEDPARNVAMKNLSNVMNLAYRHYAILCEESLESALDRLAQDIKTKYLKQCRYYTDIHKLRRILHRASESLQRLTQTTFTTINSFKIEMMKTMKELDISSQSPVIHIDNLINHQWLYEEYISDNGTNSKPEVLSNILKPSAEYMKNLDSWYADIIDLRTQLMNESLDGNTNQNNGTYWVDSPGHNINEANMRTYIMNTKLPQYDSLLSDASSVRIVVRDLNNIDQLASTLATSCEDSFMIDLRNISLAIQTTYRMKCVQSNDMNSLQKELRAGYNNMRKLVETNYTNASEFINKLLNAVQDMNIPVNRVAFSQITKIITKLQYFKGLCIGEDQNFNSSKWTSVFLPVQDYIFSLYNWYTLLLDLHHKLSRYSVQKDTTKYNVKDVRNWGVENYAQGIYIDENNIHTFLQKVGYLNLEGIKLIDTSNVEYVVYRDMNRILDLTLKNDAKVNESGRNLTIQGHYVVISRVKELLNPIKYNSVQIFALNTVFIDTDIERIGDEFTLTIIAPTWDIQGRRQIVLYGATGPNLSTSKAGQVSFDSLEKAADGQDGQPGNPGLPGGSFFGIGHVFLRGDNLVVSSRGGAGGPGQHGGNGKDGLRQAETNHRLAADDVCKLRSTLPESLPKQFQTLSYMSYILYYVHHILVFPLGVGTEGGNGGHGGKGGIGGRAGEISIISLERESEVRIDARSGPEGVGGRGGEGGGGGYTAKPLLVYARAGPPWNYASILTGCKSWVLEELPGTHLSSGIQGNADVITNGRLQPAPIQKLTKSKYINMFKRYLWSNLENAATFSQLNLFLETLEKNVETRQTYDTLSYVEELAYLDVANYVAHDNVDFIVYYRYILDSLDSYSKSSSQITLEERRVLQYVYTAVLSRICRLRARSDRSLITDLSRFLEEARYNLPKLANLKTYQEIDRINLNYKNTIDLKIKEANNFIKKHMLVEIDTVVGEIDTNIRALERETKSLQRNAYDNRNAILEYEKQISLNFFFRWTFATMRWISSILPFVITSTKSTIAPLLAGTAIYSLNNANNFLRATAPRTPTYPQGLRDTIRDIGMMTNSKERSLKTFMTLTDKIVGEIGDNYSQLKQLKTAVVEIKAQAKAGDAPSLMTARDDLQHAIILAQLDLQPDDIKAQEKLNTIIALLEESKQSLNVPVRTKNPSNSRDSPELQEAEKKIRELEMYGQQIHETFVPLLKNMHQSLRSFERNHANQSNVYLDVSRWNVQKSIRNVKHFMQQSTRGFHAGGKLERTISKLEEVSDLIINLYDRIEIYQDQKRMGDMVSSINKVQEKGIAIKDPMLKAAITDLQVVITSNTIITQYNRALNAFKQQIFPFVDSYRHLLNDDLSFGGSGEISTLVSRGEEKLQLLISAVAETKSSIQTIRDTNVITKIFSSDHLSSQPFFTWRNQTFNEEITYFLSGKEVVLKADLTISPNSEYAVKFSLINLNIRAMNETLQAELDEALKHFDIQLKHFGNSHYRCGEQFYVISGESQTFTYSFENYNSTVLTPIRSNQVYKKIKAGDISLSPYAMWSLKLLGVSSGFETLSRFKGMVNLELVGEGQYVDANAAVCKDPLDRYYDVYKD